MNQIEQMMQQLCPEGVEWRKLGEIGTIYRGTSFQKKHFVESGVPCIHYGQIYTHYGIAATQTISFVSEEIAKNRTLAKKGDLIIATTSENVEDVGKATVWLGESDIVVSNDACFFRHEQEPKYLAYIFQSYLFFDFKKRNCTGTKVMRINPSVILDFEIPLPPLPIQRRIVEILDKFTALEAELEAELDCRKRQYEYYRNQLLTFANKGGTQSVTWKKMSEIFEMRNGYTPSKAKKEFWEDGTIPWFRMEDIRQNGRILSDAIQHISEKGVKGKGLFEPNSFILATTATIGEHAWLIVGSLANQRFTNLKIRKSLGDLLLPAFVFHYLFVVDEWCKNHTNVSGFASVDMAKLKDLLFPIPPLSEQRRIVSILDRFESLTTDLQSGLPAEIAARRQQYEYYRNKLLTFDKKTA